MLDKITQTEDDYQVVIDGTEMTVPNNPSNRHYQMVQDAIADGVEVIVPVVPDPIIAERAAMTLTFSQLLIGLVLMDWITEAEGDAWLKGNELPAEVTSMIAGLPVEQRFPAKARALRMSVADRMDPLVLALAQGRGVPPEDMDVFFQTFGKL